ncbi:MAG: hypothetical protein ABIJ09_09625 [Pseudomonadota bacterium]
MLKASGARQSVVQGQALVDLVFHASIRDALISAERASFTAIGNFSLLRLLGMGLAVTLVELSAFFILALARTPWSLAAGVLALTVATTTQLTSNRLNLRSSGNLVFYPLVVLHTSYSMIRSGVLGRARGGILWRGTF